MRVALLAIALVSTEAGAHPIVALIDSGVARTPELAPVLVGEIDAASPEPRSPFSPANDHGTQIATLIARETKGRVRILSVRVDAPGGCPPDVPLPCQSDPSPIVRAIDKAVAVGVDVISISLALKDDDAIVAAVARASRASIQVVMSAGNDGRAYPRNRAMAIAGGAQAVLVGATDRDGKLMWPRTNRFDADAGGRYAFAWGWGWDVPTARADGTPVIASGSSVAVAFEVARRVREISRP